MRSSGHPCAPAHAAARLVAPLALTAVLAVADGAWGQCHEAKFTVWQGPYPDLFWGSPVAMGGDVILVGAYSDDIRGERTGSACVFRFDGAAWVREAKLLASDGGANDLFGRAVALSGDLAVVGAPQEPWPAGTGSAYVFRFDMDTSAWIEQAKLLPAIPAQAVGFGGSVAISGERILVGAPYDFSGDISPGAAYVYRYDQDTASWPLEAHLFASDAEANQRFGFSVSLSGDTAIIGAIHDGGAGSDAGAAYVYRRDPDTSSWEDETKLVATDTSAGDWFGATVSLRGDVALIGAPGVDDAGSNAGSAYVFRFATETSSWDQEAKLAASDGDAGDQFGSSVATRGDTAVIGAARDDDFADEAGSAYIFAHNGTTWGEVTKLLPVDGKVHRYFATFVDLDDGKALIGSTAYPETCHDKVGTAHLYDLDALTGPDCNENGVCDAIDLRDGASTDCNDNQVLDECDIATGWSQDCNGNMVPDDCEPDCNGNGSPDDCDVFKESSEDCNSNGIPDECETYSRDDGTIETAFGSFQNPLDLIWLNHYVVRPGEDVIDAISASWRVCATREGTPVTLLVYDDPSNDGDPTDAVLLLLVETEIRWTGDDSVAVVSIEPLFVGDPGDSFFVGAYALQFPGQFVIAADDTSPFRAASWYAGGDAGTVDLEDLQNNPVPPVSLADLPPAYHWNWILRAVPDSEATCSCASDFNGDCAVEFDDFLVLLEAWGPCADPPAPCPADLDGDGAVTVVDFLILLASWG